MLELKPHGDFRPTVFFHFAYLLDASESSAVGQSNEDRRIDSQRCKVFWQMSLELCGRLFPICREVKANGANARLLQQLRVTYARGAIASNIAINSRD